MAKRFGKLNLWVVLILVFVLGLIGYSFWNREGFADTKPAKKPAPKAAPAPAAPTKAAPAPAPAHATQKVEKHVTAPGTKASTAVDYSKAGTQ